MLSEEIHWPADDEDEFGVESPGWIIHRNLGPQEEHQNNYYIFE